MHQDNLQGRHQWGAQHKSRSPISASQQNQQKGAPNKKNDKPWQQPESGQKQKGGKGDPNSFLFSVYPDGHGPDADLIQMLERDVIDKNPNVSFDDIAELKECKKAL